MGIRPFDAAADPWRAGRLKSKCPCDRWRVAPLAGETRPAKLLAWIEPTASGGFKAVIVQARSDPGIGSAPVAQEFLTFDEAREWVEAASVTLAGEIRWMSSP